MRKVLLLIVFCLLIVGCNNNKQNKDDVLKEPEVQINEDEDKVIINLFYWESCSHCHEEIGWLETIERNYDYLAVKYYEVEEYTELVDNVRNELAIEGSSVPLTVIGTDFFIGFGGSAKAKIMNTIEKYSGHDYCDLVNLIKNNEDTGSCFDKNNNIE